MTEHTKYGPFRNDDAESNVVPYRQPKPVDHAAFRAEIVNYFTQRRNRLKIVKTTQTPRGQMLDWIPVESQHPRGVIASPPPDAPSPQARNPKRAEQYAVAELAHEGFQRGPKGTVPMLRKKLDALGYTTSLRQYLSKYHGPVVDYRGTDVLVPGPGRGTHWLAQATDSIICFGGEGHFSCFDPYTDSSDEFSLLQICLVNAESGVKQTVEAGWQEYQNITGDWVPHLFVYYTNNGYSWDDDGQGGYNMDVDGWVQVDDVIFPGTTFTPYSTIGGDQHKIVIQYRLHQDNWWLRCQGRWVGYYPSKLFMGNGHAFTNLADHADRVKFYGEVASRNSAATKTDMGSGRFADEGWTQAAYIHNLRVQTGRNGDMSDFEFTDASVADTSLYTLDIHLADETDWGSFVFVGGPGAGLMDPIRVSVPNCVGARHYFITAGAKS